MAVREPLPAPFLRAAQGLADGSGRTVVIAGPEASGKSALLEQLTTELTRRGVRVRLGRGVYRDRETPFATVGTLADAGVDAHASEPEAPVDPPPETPDDAPFPAIGYIPEPSGGSRRARGERQRGHVMGLTYAVRGRGVAHIDAREYWENLAAESQGAGTIALAIEDGAAVDPESRDLLLFLSEHARLSPVLVVLVLDSSHPSFGAWEERLAARHDVDWVRTSASQIDPREASRIKKAFDALALTSRQVVTTTCLMGGVVSEVHLSRFARLTFSELADALLPASEARLVRVEPGRVVVPHQPSIAYIPTLSSPAVVRELHREIAEALEALHPEPSLARRRELADHYFAWEPGPVALRYLLESAELSAQLLDFDTVDGLLRRAIQCVATLPGEDRGTAEAELRFFRARALVFGGRAAEAGDALGEGVDAAVREGITDERLEEWLEPLLVALQAAGPRPGLVAELAELADRLHEVGRFGPESLLSLGVVEDEVLRGRSVAARHSAHRVGHLARLYPDRPPLVPIALMTVALTRLAGGASQAVTAERYLRSAALALAPLRRGELEQMAIEYRCRLLGVRHQREVALAAHLQGIGVTQRMRLPSLEALHQLGVAELTLDKASSHRSERALARARELVDRVHLNPPALAPLWLWLLEGRQAADAGDTADARDWWTAIVQRPEAGAYRSLRGEALLRLACLDLLHGRPEAAREAFGQAVIDELFPPDLASAEAREGHVRHLGTLARSGAARVELLLGR